MKTIKEGVRFSLSNFSSEKTQEIRFTEKDQNGNFNDGTTNEEVIQMMIDRFYFLQKNRWSPENAAIIILLKNIRQLLKKRLAKKIETLIANGEEGGKSNNDRVQRY